MLFSMWIRFIMPEPAVFAQSMHEFLECLIIFKIWCRIAIETSYLRGKTLRWRNRNCIYALPNVYYSNREPYKTSSGRIANVLRVCFVGSMRHTLNGLFRFFCSIKYRPVSSSAEPWYGRKAHIFRFPSCNVNKQISQRQNGAVAANHVCF